MPRPAARRGEEATAQPRRRRVWLRAALAFGGCCFAGWLGAKAGHYFQFGAGDFRPAPPPHVYVSGPTYLEADAPLAPAREHGT